MEGVAKAILLFLVSSVALAFSLLVASRYQWPLGALIALTSALAIASVFAAR